MKSEDPSSHLGKWNLKEYHSSWFPETTPVSELGYSETYEFRANGTFTKSNSELDRTLNGTYTLTPADEEFKDRFQSDLTLSYDASDLEGFPTDESGSVRLSNREPFFWVIYGINNTEVVFLRTDGTLTNAGYGWADGGEYVYRK